MNKEQIEKTYKEVKKILLNKNIFNLSALDYRIMVFNQKMKNLFTKYGDVEQRMRNIEEIFDLIHQYLGVSEVEKKINGEVFTPFELINEMLDTLPKEVWFNPNLKWLDPANGIGNFPAVIIQRLMGGLTDFEPNPEKRYKHILENMIYVCDISSKNMFLYLNIFDPNNEYKMNYFKGSFLSDEFDNHMKDVWGLEGFDFGVGNPPFQSNNNKGNKLWIKILDKNFQLCSNNTYVVPSSLLTSESKQITDLRSGLINKTNVFNLTKKDIFNVGEKVVYFTSTKYGDKNNYIIFPNYVRQQITNILDRQPVDENDNIKLSIFRKIERYPHKNDYVYDFNRDSNQTTPKRLVNSGLASYNQDGVFKYKVHHSASKILYTNTLVSKYSKNNETTYGKLKVVLNYSGGFVGDKYMFLSYDMIGKQMLGILVENEEIGNNVIKIYSSNLIKWYITNEKNGGFNSGLFKLPKLDFTREWTDQQLYEYFNLTEEEINLIEETVKE